MHVELMREDTYLPTCVDGTFLDVLIVQKPDSQMFWIEPGNMDDSDPIQLPGCSRILFYDLLMLFCGTWKTPFGHLRVGVVATKGES